MLVSVIIIRIIANKKAEDWCEVEQNNSYTYIVTEEGSEIVFIVQQTNCFLNGFQRNPQSVR